MNIETTFSKRIHISKEFLHLKMLTIQKIYTGTHKTKFLYGKEICIINLEKFHTFSYKDRKRIRFVNFTLSFKL